MANYYHKIQPLQFVVSLEARSCIVDNIFYRKKCVVYQLSLCIQIGTEHSIESNDYEMFSLKSRCVTSSLHIAIWIMWSDNIFTTGHLFAKYFLIIACFYVQEKAYDILQSFKFRRKQYTAFAVALEMSDGKRIKSSLKLPLLIVSILLL